MDAIIVGNGLAGSLLADALEACGASCAIIDDRNPATASRVAPGIVNPLAGKRMHPSWRVEAQLPAARTTYRRLEARFGVPLFSEMPIVRILRNAFECETFARRLQDPRARPYIGTPNPPGLAPGVLDDPNGSFTAHGSGRLHIDRLQAGIESRLAGRNRFLHDRFDPSRLQRSPGSVRYHTWAAPVLVFCEGWRGRENSFFRHLPFKPAKGEMLTLESDQPLPPTLKNTIINCGKWLLPVGENRFRAGATYGWDRLDHSSTPQGRTAILEALAACLAIPFRVVGQDAGVRPAIADYRPAIGRHPRFPELAICNGFGSKGALVAPWVTAQLAAYLCNETPVDPEIDVRRFDDQTD